jgi:hypothetical protein
MSATYRILDEPAGRQAARFVVDPFWPLLALMFAGAWVAAILFAMNAWFLRGPTWRRELILIVLMLAGSPAILLAISIAEQSGLLSERSIKYVMLLTVVWKIAVAYWIYFLQETAHSLHEYFESRAAPRQTLPLGVLVLAGGFMARGAILATFDSPFWKVMVG